jgi:carbon monoxide dehydrogenase subunit G
VKLKNSFRIDRPATEVFDAFLDIERVAGCMPGSRILGRSAEDVYDGEVKVKVGPLAVAYSGKLHVLDTDREHFRLTMRAKGREQRGAGNADAYVITQLSAQDGGTIVEIDTDLNIRGKVAQFGRGVITEVSDSFMQTFAANLEEMLVRGGVSSVEATPMAAGSGKQADSTHPSRHPERSADERIPPDELDMWCLIIRPMVERYAHSVAVVALSGVAAYVGARAGARRPMRSGNSRYHS